MKILKGQFWHLLLLLLLLSCVLLATYLLPKLTLGGLMGVSTKTWLVLALLSPIVHQTYVMVVWRFELHCNSISGIFGKSGFKIYKIGFFFLVLSRLITVILLAISNKNTLPIDKLLSFIVAFILLIPVAYLFYSAAKFFGINRAVGIDHFKPNNAKAHAFVIKGIFKYTSNGMYIFGFLLLWIPGILLQSQAALMVALFSHLYIWVHYYCTEKPDMAHIYN